MQHGQRIKSKVLVLNKHYMPVSLVTWKDAMTFLYKDVVYALSDEFAVYNFNDWLQQSVDDIRYNYVHTSSKTIKIPHIILLKKYNRTLNQILKLNRVNVWKRDHKQCVYCKKPLTLSQATIDHVIPFAKGGKNEWSNVVCACKHCNNLKSSKSLHETHMSLPFTPYSPVLNKNTLLFYKHDNVNIPEVWNIFCK